MSQRNGTSDAADMHAHPPVFIGITTQHCDVATRRFALRFAYVDAVRAAGGIPVLLPPGEPQIGALLNRLDALIFSGGGDLDASYYAQNRHPTMYLVDPERDQFELALARQVLTTALPVLGICRGAQVLAVASGGDLVRHIPDRYGERIAHLDRDADPLSIHIPVSHHHVSVQPTSRLAQVLGVAELDVPSMHHQAIDHAPPGWRVVAHAPDGVAEAMEREGAAWHMAVQWHPEVAARDSPHHALFRALVAAARRP